MAVDYAKCAREICDTVGGKANLVSAAHCATRLRLVTVDNSKIDMKKLEDIEGVKGVFSSNGQLQLIIGTGTVNKVYEEFLKYSGMSAASKDDVKAAAAAKQPLFQRMIKSLGDVFVPILPAIVASGLMMGLVEALAKAIPSFGSSDWFSILDLMANTAFVFLPVLISVSAARVFGGNIFLGAVIGMIMIHPNLVNAWNVGNLAASEIPVWNLLGFEIRQVGYQGHVIPVIIATWLMCKIEKWLHKHVPEMIDLFVTPLTTVLATAFLTLGIIGPIFSTAVPYIWKELGTQCRNLPQVHTIVRMMRMIGEIVCPGILPLGEVVMEPEKVVPYFGTVEKPECHMLYNVTTMATTWHTVATRDVRLLKKQLDIVNALPKNYVFLNYLRCHDDIGWGLDFAALGEEGIEEVPHKKYLNDYFRGYTGSSNSRGELYNEDLVTGDARFCATTASLCGIERAGFEGNEAMMDSAIKLDVMLHAYMFMQSGIPVLYSGDEIGQVNDYEYKNDEHKVQDSRYLHRGAFLWENAEKITDMTTVEGRIFTALDKLEKIRKSEKAFVSDADTWTLETYEKELLSIGRYYEGEKIIGIFNFSEHDKTAWINEDDGMYIDLISGRQMEARGVDIPAYGFYYLKKL